MMYPLLSELLSDKKGGLVFQCFDIAHICYMLLVFAVVLGIVFYLRNKDDATKKGSVELSIQVAFAMYILDFFLMPFAYGEMDIEKLPFHVCTAMCVMGFVSRRHPFFQRYQSEIALLGLVSNFVYLVYPAGVMWHQVHPLSYRVIQTLLFHGVMILYGVLALLYEEGNAEKKWRNNLVVIVSMTLWAMFGNFLYTGEAWGRTNYFNWFFVLRDPFYVLPEALAPWIMPFVNVFLFFIVEMGVLAVFSWVKKRKLAN